MGRESIRKEGGGSSERVFEFFPREDDASFDVQGHQKAMKSYCGGGRKR